MFGRFKPLLAIFLVVLVIFGYLSHFFSFFGVILTIFHRGWLLVQVLEQKWVLQDFMC